MKNLLDKFNIKFDVHGNTNISRGKLLKLISAKQELHVYNERNFLPHEFYLLVDRNGIDFYPFHISEFNDWEQDGSFEEGDSIFTVKFLKKITKKPP